MDKVEAYPVLEYECPHCHEIHQLSDGVINSNTEVEEFCPITNESVIVVNRYFIDLT